MGSTPSVYKGINKIRTCERQRFTAIGLDLLSSQYTLS